MWLVATILDRAGLKRSGRQTKKVNICAGERLKGRDS